jgi:hypothetical protein
VQFVIKLELEEDMRKWIGVEGYTQKNNPNSKLQTCRSQGQIKYFNFNSSYKNYS